MNSTSHALPVSDQSVVQRDRGAVIASLYATHAALLARGGAYAALVASQDAGMAQRCA